MISEHISALKIAGLFVDFACKLFQNEYFFIEQCIIINRIIVLGGLVEVFLRSDKMLVSEKGARQGKRISVDKK